LGVEAAFDMPLNRAIQPEMAEGELNRNPSRGLIVLLALTWPAIAWLLAGGGSARAMLAGLIVLAAAALSLQFDQLVTAIGFGVGLIVFGFAFIAPRLAILATSLGLSLWMLAGPFVTPLLIASPRFVETIPLSWAARVAIWRYTCAQIMEQPWIGHGLDAGRAVTDRISIRGLDMRGVPVHPHSATLQVWFETGAVGAVLIAALMAVGGWRLAKTFAHDKPAAAAAAGVLAMFGLMANVGWSIWQEWWMATLLMTAGLVAAFGARAAKA
jgi:O-antigen ligase